MVAASHLLRRQAQASGDLRHLTALDPAQVEDLIAPRRDQRLQLGERGVHHLLHPPPLVGGRRVGLAVDELGPGLGLELPGGMAPEPARPIDQRPAGQDQEPGAEPAAPGS